VVGRDHLGAALEPVDQGLRDATGLQKNSEENVGVLKLNGK
jgi:hypothetical protein